MSPLSAKRLIKIAGSLGVISVLSLLINFFTSIAIAASFGTRGELESFLVAYSIPQLLTSFMLLGGLSTVLIPLYIEIKEKDGEAEAWSFVRSFAFWFAGLSLVLMAAGCVLARQIVLWSVPRMLPAYQDLCVVLTRSLMVLVPVIFFTTLMQTLLNAEGIFVAPALGLVGVAALNLGMIYFFARSWDSWALVAGQLTTAFFPVYLATRYRDFFWKRGTFSWKINHPHLLKGIKPLFVLTAVSVANQINFMSNRFFASWLKTGQIATYDYAYKIVPILLTVVCSSLTRPFYTRYAQVVAQKNARLERFEFLRGLRYLSLMYLPLVFLILVLRVPVFTLLYERGVFAHSDTLAIGEIFVYLCPAVIFWGLAQIITSALYAMQKVALMAVLTVLGVGINIGLDYWWIRPMGLQGLAAASSVSAVYGGIVTLWFLRKHFGGLDIPGLALFYAKIGIALASLCAVAWYGGHWIGAFDASVGVFVRAARISLAGVLSLGAYFLLLFPLQVEEVRVVTAHLREGAALL